MRFAPIGALVGLLAGAALFAMLQLGGTGGDSSVEPADLPARKASQPSDAHLDKPDEEEAPVVVPAPSGAPENVKGTTSGLPAVSDPERELIPDHRRRLHGRMLDMESDEAAAAVTLWLLGGPDDWPLAVAVTDEHGKFVFEDWEGSASAVTCQPDEGWIVPEPARVAGPPWDGAELLVYAQRWPPPSAGNLSGHLVSESGEWNESDLLALESIVLDLVSLKSPRISRRGDLQFGEDGSVAFIFEDVPEGEYELTLSALDSLRWTPASMRVTPPAEGLEFLRYDQEDALPIVFNVFDAESGEAIADFETAHLQQTVSEDNGVFMHAGPLAAETFPVDAAFRWSLWSRGYAPAFGDQSAFRHGDGKLIADVFLEPGWARRFVVLGPDPTMRPLAGAEVILDGDSTGTTAADGSLTVHRDAAPESIEVRFRDWVLSSTSSSQSRTSDRVRGYTTPLIVRPPVK